MKVEVITHYETPDKGDDYSEDYWDIEIFIDGVLAETYGDYYHDKCWERSEGFLDALLYLKLIVKEDIVYTSIKDR